MPRSGKIDTNIVYFGLPEDAKLTREVFLERLHQEYNVKVTGGYSRGGKLFRAVTHMNVDDDGVDRAIEAICSLVTPSSV